MIMMSGSVSGAGGTSAGQSAEPSGSGERRIRRRAAGQTIRSLHVGACFVAVVQYFNVPLPFELIDSIAPVIFNFAIDRFVHVRMRSCMRSLQLPYL